MRDVPPAEPLRHGTQKLRVGKHSGKTFAEIYTEDPGYCRWVHDTVMRGESSSDHMKVFSAYIQHRWLQSLSHIMQKAAPGCLKEHRLAVTGEPDEMMRPLLEGLIRVLGGEVVSGGRVGGLKNAATGIVIAGSKLWDGSSVEDSPKLRKAKEAGIKIMTVSDLLKIVGVGEPPVPGKGT